MGLHVPKHKYKSDNGIVCRKCDKKKPTDQFPAFEAEGKRVCRDCLRSYNNRFQLAKYGCSEEEYNKLLKIQHGKCAICGTKVGHVSKNGHQCRLAVDHDHETGRIRGLLCGNCNQGIGRIGEKNLQKALEYIKRASE
jgi:protein-arginine kinase activator protein McsA